MEIPIKMDDLGVPLFLETPIYTYGTPFAHENVYIYAATGHGTVNVSADAIKCISTHMSYRRKYLLGENAITKLNSVVPY